MWCDGCRWSKDVVVNTDYMTYVFECKLDHALYSAPNKGCPNVEFDPRNGRYCGDCEHYIGVGDWGLSCSAHYHRLPVAYTPADECPDFLRGT